MEGWLPFRSVFDVVAAGRRHVMAGASQLDRFGNHNISATGDWRQPKVQLLGARGAPGNTVNHPTSYWVPTPSPRVFVDTVDMVSGVGYDRAAKPAPRPSGSTRSAPSSPTWGSSTLPPPDRSMQVRSLHPTVGVTDMVAATGFELVVSDQVPVTRLPTAAELQLIGEALDPDGVRLEDMPA